ncbi:hypothetical protein TNCV_808891 [Trichonephila clavipes]|nr:hypothetical protein TNCV_808891 [Trichonephila clavipes]
MKHDNTAISLHLCKGADNKDCCKKFIYGRKVRIRRILDTGLQARTTTITPLFTIPRYLCSSKPQNIPNQQDCHRVVFSDESHYSIRVELTPALIFNCSVILDALLETGVLFSSTYLYVDNIEQIARTVIWDNGTI